MNNQIIEEFFDKNLFICHSLEHCAGIGVDFKLKIGFFSLVVLEFVDCHERNSFWLVIFKYHLKTQVILVHECYNLKNAIIDFIINNFYIFNLSLIYCISNYIKNTN